MGVYRYMINRARQRPLGNFSPEQISKGKGCYRMDFILRHPIIAGLSG